MAQGKGTTGAEDGLFSYHVPAGDYEERGPGFQARGGNGGIKVLVRTLKEGHDVVIDLMLYEDSVARYRQAHVDKR